MLWFFLKVFAGLKNCNFDNQNEITSLNSDIFLTQCTKGLSNFVFIFSIDFTWNCLMDMKNGTWLALLKHFCWSLKFLLLKLRKKTNKFLICFSVNWFSLGLFRGQQTMQFWQLRWKDFAKNRCLLSQSHKVIEKLKVFQRKQILAKSPLDTEKAVLTLLLTYFLLQSKLFFAETSKMIKIEHIKSKVFPLRVCYTKELRFRQPCRNEVAKPRFDLQSKFENDDKLCTFFSNLIFARIVSRTGGKHVWRKMLKSSFFAEKAKFVEKITIL